MLKKFFALLFITSLTLGGGLSGCKTIEAKHSDDFVENKIPKAKQPSAKEIKETRVLLTKRVAPANKLKLYQSGKTYNRVNRIVRRVSRAAGYKNFVYPLYIADAGDEANAFAYQGNTMVVYKALANKVASDSELATVIAHEVAHMVAGHHDNEKQRAAQVGVAVGSAILGAIIGSKVGATAGDVSGEVAHVIGTGLVVRPYDRGMEYEADHIGMLLMAKAGYRPKYAISFWKKAEKVLGGGGKKANFLSTHPGYGDRQKRLEKSLPVAKTFYKRR